MARRPDFINPTHVAEAYGVNPSSVHVIEEAVAQNSDRCDPVMLQASLRCSVVFGTCKPRNQRRRSH